MGEDDVVGVDRGGIGTVLLDDAPEDAQENRPLLDVGVAVVHDLRQEVVRADEREHRPPELLEAPLLELVTLGCRGVPAVPEDVAGCLDVRVQGVVT
jgi:hypothetical protein